MGPRCEGRRNRTPLRRPRMADCTGKDEYIKRRGAITRIAAGASLAEAVTARSDEARSAAVDEAARGVRAMVERGPERVAAALGARRARPWFDAGTKAAAEAAMQAQRKRAEIFIFSSQANSQWMGSAQRSDLNLI